MPSSQKLYVKQSEHAGHHGGLHSASSRGATAKKPAANFARLPFDCCALTFKPFETPVCTAEGTVYDLLSIIPFIRLHGTDPVTGKKLASGDLVRLTFHRNANDQFCDPVTYKIFNEHTPLVAIKTSGNVFARDTIDTLNIKPGSWNDLVTDEPFTRADLITIQDPLNIQNRDLSQFDYIKRELQTGEVEEDALAGINVAATGVGKLLKTVAEKEAKTKALTAPTPSVPKPKPTPSPVPSTSKTPTPKPYNTSTVSTNRTAASLTSTAAPIQQTIEHALWHEEDLMFEEVKKRAEKAYVRIHTNYGNLNCELFCDKVPKTCYNFMKLASDDKYQETIFHRLIAGFMLQGGDPTGTGKGGSSIWGDYFEDEVARNAPKHDERGVLAMANHGPNTNGSQFYVTFRATPHLDGKHTVFGRLVGGDDVLSRIERVPVDPSTNRPLKPVMLKDIQVFQDPYAEYRKRLEKRLKREEGERGEREERGRRQEDREKDRTTWFGTSLGAKDQALAALAAGAGGVGKYVASSYQASTAASGKRKEMAEPEVGVVPKKKKQQGQAFGEFSGW